MKFEVGKKYEVVNEHHQETGNIIKIVKIDRNTATYKTVKGVNNGSNEFDLDSGFAQYLEPLKNECIVIYRKGDETIALDKTTGKKAVAKCHPDDEYDFNTGAKLAFERLTGEQPAAVFPKHVNCRCSTVREVKRAAKVGEYIKIIKVCHSPFNEYKKGDILKVVKHFDYDYNSKLGRAYYKNKHFKYADMEEYVVLENYQPEEKPQFKPYLKFLDHKLGCIGESTPIKDVIGRELKVGDTVELYDRYNNFKGEHAICFDDGRYFVMGIAASCNDAGAIENKWKIIKKRDYKEFKNGENADGIVYVLEEG